MKSCIPAILLIIGVTAVSPSLCAPEKIITESFLQEFHTFDRRSGTSVRGRISAYDRDRDAVTVVREDGRAQLLDLDSLSEADRTYVLEWHQIRSFFTQVHIRLFTPKERNIVGEEYLIWYPEKEIVYAIQLENRSPCLMNNLTVEYYIHYELDWAGNRGQKVQPEVKSGKLHIDTLGIGESAKYKTESLLLPRGDLFEYYKDHEDPIGRVTGIRIRLCLPLDDGRNARRELSYTGSLMKNRKWIAPAEPLQEDN